MNDNLVKSAGILAIITASILVVIKFYIWIVTQSFSVQASLFDSILDGVTSIINFVALIHAAKPANAFYRFGYGKVEALASFTQSILIACSALWLLYSLIQNFLTPELLVDTGSGVFWMSLATLMTLCLVLFQRYVIKKTNSLIIKTDSLHYETDLLVNIGVLASLILSLKYKFFYLDLIIGLIIVVYILMSTVEIFKTSCHILLDHEISNETRHVITDLVHKNSDIKHLIDFRTRSCGRNKFIELTLEFDEQLTTKQIQKISQKMIKDIQKEVENADVVIRLY